jgi:hypothetical protein
MGEFNYSRDELKAFFEWKPKPLEHFPEELHCQDQATEFAKNHPRASGYISFKSKYRGKRYFWVENGQAKEIDAMECFLKARDINYSRAKERILKGLRLR